LPLEGIEMKALVRYAVLPLVLVFGMNIGAHATTTNTKISPCPWWDPFCPPPPPTPKPKPATAPEVDPALAVSGLVLLAGSLTVLGVRRRKKLDK
jgi:LPXTG-motif cell wall-anchored protein